MNDLNIGDRVRLIECSDPSFPSITGETGIITDIRPLTGYETIYEVRLNNILYALWRREIELVDPDDLFSDDYIPARKREQRSIEQLKDQLANESAETKRKRYAKHTRKPRNEGPEAKVLKRIRMHLEKHYHARVLRTNAGHVRDQEGNVINLGDPGQSDLHAIVPIIIDDFTFGIFMAIECKAGTNNATDLQRAYLDNIKSRGGIGVVAYDVLDIDEAVAAKINELFVFVAKQRST